MAWSNGASIKQTSYNVAGNVVSAAVRAGALDYDKALDELNRVALAVFGELSKDVATSTGGERRRSSRKGSRKGGGRGGKVTLADARGMVLKFGAFEGQTLSDVMGMSLDEAEEFGYDKPGRAYIKWLTKQDRNPYVAKRAAMMLEAARGQLDDDEEFEDFVDDDDEAIEDEEE